MKVLALNCFFLLLIGSLSNPAPAPGIREKLNSVVTGPGGGIIVNPPPPVYLLLFPPGLLARWTLQLDGRAGDLNFTTNTYGYPTGTFRADLNPIRPSGPLAVGSLSSLYYTLQNLKFYNSVTYNHNVDEWFVTFTVSEVGNGNKIWDFYGQIDEDVLNMHGQFYLRGEANYYDTHIWHASKAIYATDNVLIRAQVPSGVIGNWSYLRYATPGKLTITVPPLSVSAVVGFFMGLYGSIPYPVPDYDTTQQWTTNNGRVLLRYGSWWLYLNFTEGSRSQEFFLLLNNDLTHAHGVNIIGANDADPMNFDMTKGGNTEAASPADVLLGNWTFLVKGEPGTLNIQGTDSNGVMTIPGAQEYSPGTQLGDTNPGLTFATYVPKYLYFREWGSGVYYLSFQYHWSDQSADRFFDGILDYNRKTIYGCEQWHGVFSARHLYIAN